MNRGSHEAGGIQRFLHHFSEVMERRRPSVVEAFGVGGSHGKNGSADRYSDVDLFILIKESEADKFINSFFEFTTLFGTPLLFRGPVYVPNYGYSFSVLYEPFICCQFNVNTRATLTPGPIRKYTRILFDEDGFYKSFTKTQSKESFDLGTVFQTSCSFFWLRVINVWRDLGRGQLWFAIRHMADVRQQLFVLERLKTGDIPADFFFVERNLEKDLGEDVCLSLAAALPTYGKGSITESLIFSVRRYTEEAPAVAQDLGVKYPHDADALISKLVYGLI